MSAASAPTYAAPTNRIGHRTHRTDGREVSPTSPMGPMPHATGSKATPPGREAAI
jgi:hypothetical protein